MEFSSNQILAIAGITARQLQWWDERGVVVPVRQGRRRVYSLDDLAEVAVICELRQRGFSLQKVRRVLAFLQRELGKRLVEKLRRGTECHLLTDGEHIYLENSARQVLDVLKKSRQPMFAVCLSDIVRRIEAMVREGQPRLQPLPELAVGYNMPKPGSRKRAARANRADGLLRRTAS